jgi:hypothetical protein
MSAQTSEGAFGDGGAYASLPEIPKFVPVPVPCESLPWKESATLNDRSRDEGSDDVFAPRRRDSTSPARLLRPLAPPPTPRVLRAYPSRDALGSRAVTIFASTLVSGSSPMTLPPSPSPASSAPAAAARVTFPDLFRVIPSVSVSYDGVPMTRSEVFSSKVTSGFPSLAPLPSSLRLGHSRELLPSSCV